MRIYIYSEDTNQYLDQIYLSGNNSKEEIEKNIKEYYNLDEIYYSIV